MITEERRKKIVELIHQLDVVDLKYLSEYFNVSIYTIRRDLNALEKQGVIDKTRGGAKKTSQSAFIPSLEKGMTENIEEKKSIAKAASNYICDGDTIFLLGTTINQLIIPYIQSKNVLIITNSILIAEKCLSYPKINIMILGGKVKSYRGNIFDILALQQLNDLYIDKCFLGAAGLDIDYGVTTAGSDSANFSRALMKRSRESFLLADSTKYNEKTLCNIGSLSEFHYILTDKKLSTENFNHFRAKGASILLV